MLGSRLLLLLLLLLHAAENVLWPRLAAVRSWMAFKLMDGLRGCVEIAHPRRSTRTLASIAAVGAGTLSSGLGALFSDWFLILDDAKPKPIRQEGATVQLVYLDGRA